jgi:hypothetical protein
MARGLSLFATVFAMASTSAGARAQTESDKADVKEQPTEPVTAQSHPNNPELWNVEQMMEDAVIQISRRYNLNDAQTEYTRLLLTERTLAFLEVHEADVRTLLRESIDLRLGKMASTPGALKDWAERAMPIYKAAEDAILQGNEEWREILDPEQIKIHDGDLAAMRTNFNNVTNMLSGWKSGAGPNSATAQAGRPQGTGLAGGGDADNQAARVSNPPQSVVRQNMEDVWETYVKRFITIYQLDDKQANAALEGIYQDIHQQAVKYRETNKAKFEDLERGEAAADTGDSQTKLTAQRRHLEEPLNRLFIKLDARLKDLLSNRQLAAVDPILKKEIDALYNTLAGISAKNRLNMNVTGKPEHRAAAGQASDKRPADSQPAESKDDSDAEAPSKPKKPAIAD